MLVVQHGYALADVVRAAAVDEVQRPHTQPVVVIHRSVRQPEVAVEVLGHEDKAHRKDWQACAEAGCCVVGSSLGDRTDPQQAEVRRGRPACLLAQHQRGHHFVWHRLMPLGLQSARSAAPRVSALHNK